MGLLGAILGITGCGTVMDGPGMEWKPALGDYNGRWMTEEGFPFLAIEDGAVTLSYQDERGRRQKLDATAQLSPDGTLIPGEGTERLGFYSSIRKEGKFLHAVDALTGQVDVFALGRDGFKADNIREYNGIWLTRDGDLRLVIENGKVTKYRKDAQNGRYTSDGSGKAEFYEDGDRCLHPAGGSDTMYGLTGYSQIMKKGDLLYATVPVMDAHAWEDVFAREGHEDDLPPLPVYVKAAEDVADRRIRRLRMFASCFDRDKTGDFIFKELPGCAEACELDLRVTASRLTGEKWVSGSVSRKNLGQLGMGESEHLREVSFPLSETLEKKLADVLLSPAVLECNPGRDSSDMMCPTVHFTLEAEFASGEEISVDTAYGVPISDAALGLAELLLGGEYE